MIYIFLKDSFALAVSFINSYESVSWKLGLKYKGYLENWKTGYLYVPDGSFESPVNIFSNDYFY